MHATAMIGIVDVGTAIVCGDCVAGGAYFYLRRDRVSQASLAGNVRVGALQKQEELRSEVRDLVISKTNKLLQDDKSVELLIMVENIKEQSRWWLI